MTMQLYQKDILKLAAHATGHGCRADLIKSIITADPNADSLQSLDVSELEKSIISHEHRNPLCGDKITLHIYTRKNAGNDMTEIIALTHETEACVLCQASASIIGQHAIGIDHGQAIELQEFLKHQLDQNTFENISKWPQTKWEIYKIFQPVSDHKNRHTCVTLPIDALIKALA